MKQQGYNPAVCPRCGCWYQAGTRRCLEDGAPLLASDPMVRTFGPEDLSSTRKTVVEVEIHALVDLRHRPEPPEERTALWSGRNRLAARRPPPRLHPEQRAESGLVTLRTGGLMTLQTGGPVTLRTGGIEARLQRSLDEEVTLEGHD